ncbi:hypothetical protein BGZ75_009391 [Mortierella antarctica]|nr:hypothetical protein BGZ75_009391 [Mortierella antarctica]
MFSSRRRYTRVLVLAAIFASTALLALASAQSDCGKNELYSNCGSSCPNTCENINSGPRICTLNCVSGCFCTAGLVRRKDGQCVHRSKCKASTPAPAPATTSISVPAPATASAKSTSTPTKKSKKCKKDEVYRERKTSCERSCENPKACSKNREAGCFCKDSLLRARDGLCVRKQSCKKKSNTSKPKSKATQSKTKSDRKKPKSSRP